MRALIDAWWPLVTSNAVEAIVMTASGCGATVRQLTNYMGHSSHFYFTYPCWYDNGRKIVIYSDRENRTNLFGVDLESGDITQLTDLEESLGAGLFQRAGRGPAFAGAASAGRQPAGRQHRR